MRTYSRADTASLADDPARIRLMSEGSDVIVNATNDDQHLNVLNILQHVDGFILSEKPLVAPQDSIPDRWTEAWGSGDRFAMNCIERYSPAVDYVLAQTHRRDLRIARIDFTWAKNRFDDPRPTVGVVSEVVHPLDLCCYLTGASAEDVHLHNAAVINSDYTSFTDDTPESVQIMASMNGVAVTGYSSFAHPDRRCAFDIILVGDDGIREYVELILTTPVGITIVFGTGAPMVPDCARTPIPPSSPVERLRRHAGSSLYSPRISCGVIMVAVTPPSLKLLICSVFSPAFIVSPGRRSPCDMAEGRVERLSIGTILSGSADDPLSRRVTVPTRDANGLLRRCRGSAVALGDSRRVLRAFRVLHRLCPGSSKMSSRRSAPIRPRNSRPAVPDAPSQHRVRGGTPSRRSAPRLPSRRRCDSDRS